MPACLRAPSDPPQRVSAGGSRQGRFEVVIEQDADRSGLRGQGGVGAGGVLYREDLVDQWPDLERSMRDHAQHLLQVPPLCPAHVGERVVLSLLLVMRVVAPRAVRRGGSSSWATSPARSSARESTLRRSTC